MAQLEGIPQAQYDAAAEALLAGMDGLVDPETFRSVYLLHQAADAAREVATRDALDPYAVSWTQFEVLWNIWIFGESEAGWVSRAAMISKSGLTTIFAHLERRGLIQRRVDPADGRKALVMLSAQGQALMIEMFSKLNQVEARFVGSLSRDQRAQLVEILESLLADR
ncbi:MAG: winged helix-turn-helix transcriptional regulator [Micropruina sp.]|nr:winged helix-turn-helix transcriptional regulator [Micropruina sp.]